MINLPVKDLVPYVQIPLNALQAINTVITKDEGGWQLTSISKDNDGGWTLGGMTSVKFSEYFPGVSKQEIEAAIGTEAGFRSVKEYIIRIYYQDYYEPLSGLLVGFDSNTQPMYLSAIVNCGISGFKNILQDAKKGSKTFCSAWKDRYFQIYNTNPARYGIFIHGWIERVWRYVA